MFSRIIILKNIIKNYTFRFCREASERLGHAGNVQEIKDHVFFRGVDWEHIRWATEIH